MVKIPIWELGSNQPIAYIDSIEDRESEIGARKITLPLDQIQNYQPFVFPDMPLYQEFTNNEIMDIRESNLVYTASGTWQLVDRIKYIQISIDLKPIEKDPLDIYEIF